MRSIILFFGGLFLASFGTLPSNAKEVIKSETRLFLTPTTSFEKVISKGDAVLEVTLRPEILLVLEEDGIDAENGEVLLPAGTHLIPQYLEDGSINFCTTKPSRGNMWTGEVMMCLFSRDAEEYHFDRYVWTVNALGSGVASGLFVPENSSALKAVVARAVPPTNLREQLSMRLRWVGGDGQKKPISFAASFCVDGKCDWQTGRAKASLSEGRKEFTFLSFEISCDSKERNVASCSVAEGLRKDYLALDVYGVTMVEGENF